MARSTPSATLGGMSMKGLSLVTVCMALQRMTEEGQGEEGRERC